MQPSLRIRHTLVVVGEVWIVLSYVIAPIGSALRLLRQRFRFTYLLLENAFLIFETFLAILLLLSHFSIRDLLQFAEFFHFLQDFLVLLPLQCCKFSVSLHRGFIAR